ncbi:DUF2255 family protein [Aeromicrobium choanae]|uniref:DUF2255 family protein n=1 Tax=Aeromicrobium choanae TaxID=1736691 RepID=A0A1T4Z481_9ACTN|nr:DUF2255 family protein [Aeromicrobium choanae]SKB08877.1 hypothetical protein SAMN06295964_2373 [Aeromicrobium choanae]
MTSWTPDELERIGEAEELHIASRRKDGTLRPFIIIWVVRVDEDVYVRSAYGTDNPWYRRAVASGTGRIRAGGLERDVTFATPDGSLHQAIDSAYHAKYDRYGPAIVGSVTGPGAAAATFRLDPTH